MNIKFLTKNQIDKKKWDKCVSLSSSKIIYAYSWYLNSVIENWGGLIVDDYSCIMPIVWGSKYGLKYIYRPFLIQQLGIFCKKDTEYSTELFLSKIPKKFKHITYNFNYTNHFENTTQKYNNNYILDLNSEYEILRKNFSKNTKSNTNKAKKNNLSFDLNIDLEHLIQLKKENVVNPLKESDFNKLRNLKTTLKNNAFVWGVYSKKTLLSAVFFAFNNNTFYYLAATTSEIGKKERASFFLMDNFIQKNCNQNLKIDFEGSNIPGVARFFAGWGAKNFKYSTISINNLPFFLKKFKK